MHFTAFKNDLNSITQIALRAVSQRNPLPVLSCLLFESQENSLTVTATDLEFGICCTMPVETLVNGAAALPGKYVSSFFARLPETNIDVITDLSTNATTFSYGNSEMVLHGFPTEEFPRFPAMPEQPSFSIGQEVYKKMLSRVLFAVAYDEHRPVFNGVNIRISAEGILSMVATDTRKLAFCEEKVDHLAGQIINVIVPGKTLIELFKILENTEEEFSIYITENKIFFQIGSVCLMSRLIAGQYPDYNIVIPGEYICEVKAPVEDLINAAERAMLLISTRRTVFNIKFQPGTLMVYFNSESGRIREEIGADFSGTDIDVGFNVKFFIDLLKAMDTDEVIIKLSGDDSPALFKPVGRDDCFSILVPAISKV